MSKKGREIVRLLRKEPDTWNPTRWEPVHNPNNLFRRGQERSFLICGLKQKLEHLQVLQGEAGTQNPMKGIKLTLWDKFRIQSAAQQVCWHKTRR